MEVKSRQYIHCDDAIASDLMEITEYHDYIVYKLYRYSGIRKVPKEDLFQNFHIKAEKERHEL